MRALLMIVAVCLISTSAFADVSDVINAPSGQYSIVQTAVEQGVEPILHFRDKSKPDVILKTSLPGFNAYLAMNKFSPELSGLLRNIRSDYFISPDESWIVRDEHPAAGCNILVLYEIMPRGKLQVDFLNPRVFDCVGFAPGHYGRLAVQFVSWDVPAELVHLKIHANQGDTSAYPVIDGCKVAYNLRTHRMIRE